MYGDRPITHNAIAKSTHQNAIAKVVYRQIFFTSCL
jgi:hypothetical protein